jgi:hypothetical protein
MALFGVRLNTPDGVGADPGRLAVSASSPIQTIGPSAFRVVLIEPRALPFLTVDIVWRAYRGLIIVRPPSALLGGKGSIGLLVV